MVDIALRVVAGVLVDGFNVAPNNQLGDGVDGPGHAVHRGLPVPLDAALRLHARPRPGQRAGHHPVRASAPSTRRDRAARLLPPHPGPDDPPGRVFCHTDRGSRSPRTRSQTVERPHGSSPCRRRDFFGQAGEGGPRPRPRGGGTAAPALCPTKGRRRRGRRHPAHEHRARPRARGHLGLRPRRQERPALGEGEGGRAALPGQPRDPPRPPRRRASSARAARPSSRKKEYVFGVPLANEKDVLELAFKLEVGAARVYLYVVDRFQDRALSGVRVADPLGRGPARDRAAERARDGTSCRRSG